MAKKRRAKTAKELGIKPLRDVPKYRSAKTPIHFTVEVHHKHRHVMPGWMLNNPTFTVVNSFKKGGLTTKGRRANAVTVWARLLIRDKGLSQKEAARQAVEYFKDYPGIPTEAAVFRHLRNGRHKKLFAPKKRGGGPAS